MLRSLKCFGVCVALCMTFSLCAANSDAGTIIKLSLGSDSPADIEFDGTTLSTVDDGAAPATTGEQNTAVDFTDFVGVLFADIPLNVASFSLNGLIAAGDANVIANVLVIQDFAGGTMELYDAANVLLLSGSLDNSTLAGPLGPPATGGLFTTSFGTVTGGILMPYLDQDSLSLSMTLTDINQGAGLSVSLIPGGPAPTYSLNAFDADATIAIVAEPIPEPASAILLTVSALVAAAGVRLLKS